MMNTQKKQTGFTILELLIIIVVIGIISTIVIVSYRGVQGQAHDVSIQNDLKDIASKLELYKLDNKVYPAGPTQLATLGVKVSKNSYGNHMLSGGVYYNLLYCRMPAAAPTTYALVAFSKSGNDLMFVAGRGLSPYVGSKTGSSGICTTAGVPLSGAPSERDFFYNANIWQSFVAP